MEIKFVGTGGAFDFNYINSSALVSLDGKKYLIDCGHSVFPQLLKKNIVEDIDAVIISHLHDDHIGSLASFGFYSYYALGKKLKILLPEHQGFCEKFKKLVSLTMVHFENFISISNVDNTSISAIETTGRHYDMETFSFLFTENNNSLMYSGDLGDPDYLFEYIKQKNISVQAVYHDISFIKVPAHAYYKDLIKWQSDYNIYGYHCNPEKNPGDNSIPLVFNQPELNF